MPDATSPPAEIGILGGSGLYQFVDDPVEVRVDTPFGPPSDVLTMGEVGGRRVAFLPRHGRGHRLPPHRLPYRANLWALRSVGARQVLGPCAVGGLHASYGPGTLVVPDQLVDRTTGREQTYFDGPPAGVVHVAFAEPYCQSGRQTVLSAASAGGWSAVDGGALVVIDGPRFSTRAESRWYATQGWRVVGMTGHPEAVLARELALCYTALALVTDLDAGVDAGTGVSQAEVFAVFAANVERLRGLLVDVIRALPSERSCACGHALDGLDPGIELP
jgi:5'-methylthioadenosine phosphorylase